MAQMASKPRMASGEFDYSGGDVIINHNLGTRKLLAILQRVNSDHSNINNDSTRYRSILNVCISIEALDYDTEQTYSYQNGNQLSFVDSGTSNTYPNMIHSYFAASNGTEINGTAINRPDRGINTIDDNSAEILPTYVLETGRWIWRIYALD